MKFTALLLKNARCPQVPEKTPFEAIMTMKLNNYVSGKFETTKVQGCLHEMSLVIACLTENNYENKMCGKELADLTKCCNKHHAERKALKMQRLKEKLTPGETKLSHTQIRHMFKQHPN